MTKAVKHIFIISTIAVFIILLDSYTKSYVLDVLGKLDTEIYGVTSFFNIVLVKNYGISFGAFNYERSSQTYLIVLTSLITFIFFVWGVRSNDVRLQYPIGLVVGGAIGNLIDRFSFGSVIDFLDFHYGGQHFPAFNVADSAIFLGIFVIVVLPNINSKTTQNDTV
jgi:signal peptidase II